jgi:hypothetical protein
MIWSSRNNKQVTYAGVLILFGFVFMLGPTLTDYIYATEIVLHERIYDETSSKIGIENRTCHGSIIYTYRNDMFIDFLAEYIIVADRYEDVMQYVLNMCFYDV